MKAPDHLLIHCWRPWSRRTRSSFCVFIRSPKTPNDIQMRFCASSHSGQGEAGQTILGCIKISADLYIYRFRPSFAEEHGQGMKYCHLKPTEMFVDMCLSEAPTIRRHPDAVRRIQLFWACRSKENYSRTDKNIRRYIYLCLLDFLCRGFVVCRY